MIFLYAVVIFFSSTGREPFTVIAQAPSAAACEAKATEQSRLAEKDPEVSGYTFKCITVPSKT